jgi:hypothetical protein
MAPLLKQLWDDLETLIRRQLQEATPAPSHVEHFPPTPRNKLNEAVDKILAFLAVWTLVVFIIPTIWRCLKHCLGLMGLVDTDKPPTYREVMEQNLIRQWTEISRVMELERTPPPTYQEAMAITAAKLIWYPNKEK